MSQTILPRVAAGEADAVQDCLQQYGGLVWSLARTFCRNPSDAEEAVQEIFMEIWKSSARYDPNVASETTFIATVARRRLIDRVRRIKRRPPPASLGEEGSLPPSSAPGAEELVSRSEEAARAAEYLGRLQEDQRRALELSIYRGMSHREVSESMGIPLGTVKTHVRRGLLRLREMLKTAEASAAAGGRP